MWVLLFKSCYMIFLCCLFYDVRLLQDFSSTPSCGCTHPLLFVPLQPHPRLLRNLSLFHSDATFPKLSLICLKFTRFLEAPACRKQTLLQAWQNTCLKIHKQMNFEGDEPFPYSDHSRKYLLPLCCSVQL